MGWDGWTDGKTPANVDDCGRFGISWIGALALGRPVKFSFRLKSVHAGLETNGWNRFSINGV